MQHALRPYATAGAAIVGASLIAVTPLAAPLPSISKLTDVLLTASDNSQLGDLLAPWIGQYNTASENASQLANNHFLAPGVGFQQLLQVQSSLWQQLLDDPSKAGAITDEMQQNWKTLSSAFTLLNADQSTISSVTPNTMDGTHGLLFGMLPGFLPPSVPADEVAPIVNFLASPFSAMLIGMLGPSISPWVALGNSITAGDGFNETLANMTGAYFNGATLNLDSLIPLIGQTGLLPSALNITNLDFAFGGLLSPGANALGPLQTHDASGDVLSSVTPVGGSIFNSLGITISGVPILGNLTLDSHGIGPIAAMEAWQQIMGNELGSGWNAGGKGQPSDANPPGSGIQFPTIPTDYFNHGTDGSAAAASLDSVLASLLSGSGDTGNVADQLTDLFNTMPGGDALADIVNSMF